MPHPTTDQLRAARALLGKSQPEIADSAGVSTMTIKRAEGSGQPPASKEAIAAICSALEAAGVIFVEENGEGPGVRLRKSTPGSPDAAALDRQIASQEAKIAGMPKNMGQAQRQA